MELFYENGHLTEQALHCTASNGELDELARLEVAEHLSFCDECVLKYTALLEEGALLEPAHPTAPSVQARIRHRARILFFNRYTAAAACAALVFGLWAAGVFTAGAPGGNVRKLTSLNQAAVQITQNASSWAFDRILDFNRILVKPERSSKP